MATKADLTREQRITKEYRRLRRLFKELPKDRKSITESLLRNAAFMTVALEDLQETINRDGVVSEYQNGENQWGTKKSPEVDVYNVMIKNHLAVIKQLVDLLPANVEPPKEDELMGFVKRRSR